QMSHLHLISPKLAFRHYRRERTRFQLSHNTRTHAKPHIKTCGRICWPSQRRSVSLLHVVSYVFAPLDRRFTFTPTLHLYLTLCPFHHNAEYKNKSSFVSSLLNPGYTSLQNSLSIQQKVLQLKIAMRICPILLFISKNRPSQVHFLYT